MTRDTGALRSDSDTTLVSTRIIPDRLAGPERSRVVRRPRIPHPSTRRAADGFIEHQLCAVIFEFVRERPGKFGLTRPFQNIARLARVCGLQGELHDVAFGTTFGDKGNSVSGHGANRERIIEALGKSMTVMIGQFLLLGTAAINVLAYPDQPNRTLPSGDLQ